MRKTQDPRPRTQDPKPELTMSFLKRLFGKEEPPKQRVQVCVECGMPVAEHKNWCSILQGQIEMNRRAAEKSAKAT